jgi:hypothetical protein
MGFKLAFIWLIRHIGDSEIILPDVIANFFFLFVIVWKNVTANIFPVQTATSNKHAAVYLTTILVRWQQLSILYDNTR